MRLGVDRDGHGLATIAQVKVRALGVHALVPHAMNSLATRITSSKVGAALATIEATLEGDLERIDRSRGREDIRCNHQTSRT